MRTGIFILICLGVTLLAGCDKEPEVGEVVSTFKITRKPVICMR